MTDRGPITIGALACLAFGSTFGWWCIIHACKSVLFVAAVCAEFMGVAT